MNTSIPNIDLGTGLLKIQSVHSGYYFNCVVFIDDSVKCFGDNDYGQLAVGPTTAISDQQYEMGTNLTYSELFSPTTSPTKLPTSSPTKACSYYMAKLCNYDYKCNWQKVNGIQKCVIFDCTIFNKGKCGKERKRCKWKKDAKLSTPRKDRM